MTIKLQTLSLHNFKGIKEMTLSLDGRDMIISGENGAGKTTIVDAFLWLLFGKDSENRSQFEIKTLDKNNQPFHNLEHEVEAVLTIDGKKVTLRKLLKEIWTKPRGKSQQVFDGHTTDYWINEEPFKAKEYASYITNLIDDEKFRLITNPLYFSTKVDWKDRRRLLLEICEEVSADAIISVGGTELEGLTELLGDRTIEAARKIVTDKRKMANDELDKIPAQIEAVTRALPTLLEDYTGVQSELDDCNAKITELDEQAESAAKAIEPIKAKGRELGKLEQEQEALLARLQREDKALLEDNQRKAESDERSLKAAETNAGLLHSNLARLRAQQIDLDNELQRSRAEWDSEYKTSFEEPLPDDLICKSCGQDLPAAKRTELIEAARDRFEKKKQENITAITNRGLKLKDQAESLNTEISELEMQHNEATSDCDKLKSICDLNKTIADSTPAFEQKDHTTNPKYIEIGARITALRAELDGRPAEENTVAIAEKRVSVYNRQLELMKVLSERDASESSNKVINDLRNRERELSNQIAEFDGQLFMLDAYVRIEAELLEGNINAKFKTLSFKLFKEQINGGLQPTCEALIAGVPFAEANTAGQFNAGMEIIDTLCEHFSVNAPVFVDRCESINKLTPIKSQVIRMVVVSDADMAIAMGLPNVTTVRAARSDISVKAEEKETA